MSIFDQEIQSPNVNSGFGKEPSLRKLIKMYYLKHFDAGKAEELTEGYIARLQSAARQPVGKDGKDYIEFLDRQNDSLRRAIHAIMAKLTFLLDEDQFADVDAIALAAGVEPPAQAVDVACKPVGEPVSDAGRSAAYDAIDRFLRNNMDDAAYAEYVEHLEALWAAVHAQAVDLGLQLDRYDTGLLGDGGGGDVAWWQDYIRAELDRAHDFYQDQADAHG